VQTTPKTPKPTTVEPVTWVGPCELQVDLAACFGKAIIQDEIHGVRVRIVYESSDGNGDNSDGDSRANEADDEETDCEFD
jgi:hypothetical protein